MSDPGDRPPAAPPRPARSEAAFPGEAGSGDLPAARGPATPVARDDAAEETEHMLAIFGGVERKGEWEPARHLRVVAFCGGVRLDLRHAALLETTEVDVTAIMGGVELVVPADMDLDVRGLGIMGGFTHVQQRASDPAAPRLRVRGFALMGGVEVKRR